MRYMLGVISHVSVGVFYDVFAGDNSHVSVSAFYDVFAGAHKTCMFLQVTSAMYL